MRLAFEYWQAARNPERSAQRRLEGDQGTVDGRVDPPAQSISLTMTSRTLDVDDLDQ